jgi:3-hydroxyisobutyrate dehydrogenase-like beta-hydroxyacid dehydrogenase
MKIGLVGLGQMGSAMARRLLAQGHALTVYNRSAGAAAQFAALGAAVAPDLKTLAATVDTVFTVVSDSADVEAVVLGEGGLLSGAHADTLIVDCSTIDPQVSLKVGDAVRQAGFAMMDAPIGGRRPSRAS